VGKRYQITRAAELESLAAFRDFINAACREHPQFDEQFIYDLKLSVDEACTNVITHGYAGMDPGSIILTLELDEQRARITITDFGHPFEPYEPEAPDLEAGLEGERLEYKLNGGFGLFLIYQTMDRVDYETTEDGNCLKLVKER
jgi:serine/threonine-protein kinase RsbW